MILEQECIDPEVSTESLHLAIYSTLVRCYWCVLARYCWCISILVITPTIGYCCLIGLFCN